MAFLAKRIESNFPVYSYDDYFKEAAKLAYEHVKDKMLPVSLPLQFWLKPSQAIKYGAGDLFDKAVLLCSLLIALGNLSSKVVVVVKNDARNFVVYYELPNRAVSIDIENGIREYDNVEALMNDMHMGSDDDETTAFEFNDKMYRDIV